ncbi:MAG TPA: phage/plasmid primase, P4 family, partial [Xylella sp.]
KAHVWFWLATPCTSEQLKAWAASCGLKVDTSVFNAVQIHYTAAPVFEAGVCDPVPVRSGFVPGWGTEAVDLKMEAAVLAAAQPGGRISRHQRLLAAASHDPVAQRLEERGLVLSTGKQGELFIQCPLSERHTQDSCATATVYYPAHTGGYEKGAFVCQHAHCREVPQSVFLGAIGLDPVEDMAMFEVITDEMVAQSMLKAVPLDVPEALHLTTDQANAVRLVKRYGQRLMSSSDRWFFWTGTHWAHDEAAAYRVGFKLSKIIHIEADQWRARKADNQKEQSKNEKIAAALLKWSRKSEMRGAVEAALRFAKPMLVVDQSKLDSDPWLLNCANGTVDLRTGALRAHRPEDYITRAIKLPYRPEARAPAFKEMLTRITCEEGRTATPLSDFLQRWFGYCATGSVQEQAFAVHYGQGRNGKSTLLDLIAGVLGGYAGGAAPGLLMSGSRDRHPTEIADLAGRRMVTAHETSEGGVLREEFVKQATGGDTIKARYMRGDFFEFQPTHKLQLLTNHKPVVKGQDEGIWRRVMLIPFMARFGDAEEVAKGRATYLRDTRILEHLSVEREGILAWIVAGAVAWHRDGLNPPDIVLAASKDYQVEQDRVSQFLSEECELSEEYEEKISTPMGGGLYPAYVQWCKDSGMYAFSKVRFLGELERCVTGFKKYQKYETGENARRCKFLVIQGLRLANTEL